MALPISCEGIPHTPGGGIVPFPVSRSHDQNSRQPSLLHGTGYTSIPVNRKELLAGRRARPQSFFRQIRRSACLDGRGRKSLVPGGAASGKHGKTPSRGLRENALPGMKASRPSSLDPIRNESKRFCLQGPKGPCGPRTEKDRKTAFAHHYSPPESGFNIDLRRPSGQAFSHAHRLHGHRRHCHSRLPQPGP